MHHPRAPSLPSLAPGAKKSIAKVYNTPKSARTSIENTRTPSNTLSVSKISNLPRVLRWTRRKTRPCRTWCRRPADSDRKTPRRSAGRCHSGSMRARVAACRGTGVARTLIENVFLGGCVVYFLFRCVFERGLLGSSSSGSLRRSGLGEFVAALCLGRTQDLHQARANSGVLSFPLDVCLGV